jgi:hypothetical protein
MLKYFLMYLVVLIPVGLFALGLCRAAKEGDRQLGIKDD